MSNRRKTQNGEPQPGEPPKFEIQPVRIDPKAAPEQVERVPIFYIGDKEYTAKKRVDGRTALRMLRIGGEAGVEAMQWAMLEDGLGKQAIDDLIACEAVSDEQVKLIFTQLTQLYYGQVRALGKVPG